jgi:alginate O-acetyltransferase complex protein AlgI
MAFTSHIFLFYFLPVLLALYYALPRRFLLGRNLLLLAASYVSYAWIDPRFAGLLFAMTVVNYALSRWIGVNRTKGSRLLLTVCAVVIDLAVLGFFKYTGFFQGNLNDVLSLAGAGFLPVLKVVLPVGISDRKSVV